MLFELVLLVFLQTALAVDDRPFYDVDDYKAMGHHFEQFMKQYNRQYSGSEKADRFKIFIENLMEINELNKKHLTATFDINKFSDVSKKEMEARMGFSAIGDGPPLGDCAVVNVTSDKSSPAAWDWRDKGFVSPAKDQETCGSCWAFSTIGLLESRSLQKGQNILMSEQQLVDCDTVSSGCNGGLMTWALSALMKEGGVEAEKDYPYSNSRHKCAYDASKVVAKVASCSAYSLQNEAALQDLLYKEGPLSIAVDAHAWSQYHRGIYNDCSFIHYNHAVLLVGYGTEDGKDFWLIKNSWGDAWGENGFIRIPRGNGCMGIAGVEPFLTVSAALA